MLALPLDIHGKQGIQKTLREMLVLPALVQKSPPLTLQAISVAANVPMRNIQTMIVVYITTPSGLFFAP
jgi:hypothetical protein